MPENDEFVAKAFGDLLLSQHKLNEKYNLMASLAQQLVKVTTDIVQDGRSQAVKLEEAIGHLGI